MAITLRDVFKSLFENYASESKAPLKKNSFAQFVRKDGAEAIAHVLTRPDLKIEGSVGQGNWAEIPWFGIFNPESTTSATGGIYVVYLLSADRKSLFIVQGQGVTKVKKEFGTQQVGELRRRAELIRSRVPEFSRSFNPGPISLRGTTPLAKEYDEAVAYFIEYKRDALPEDATLEHHLREIVTLYDLLLARGGTDNVDTAIDFSGDNTDEALSEITERRRYVRHARIERSSQASKMAKKVLGHICQGCGFDFEKVYGERGADFIEAHHLIPLHSLPEGKAVTMDPQKDFAVLCCNCHRMVHRGKVFPVSTYGPDLRL